MPFGKLKFLQIILITWLLMTCSALSFSVSAASLINQSYSGIGIQGYDPVAYFTENRPVKGSAAISYRWLGATWYFASAEHRDMFESDPIKYMPQYGGYCAASMTDGSLYDADPTAWQIVDGMLYLNYSARVMTNWSKDVSNNIAAADVKWTNVKSTLKQ